MSTQSTSGQPPVLPRHRLLELVNMRYLSQAISIAGQKGIANIVSSESAVHISEVARQLDCHENNLYRLMSFLAAYGIFEEKEGRHFIGNEMSDAMREDTTQNCSRMNLAYGSKSWYRALVDLERALEKNNEKTPFELVNGEPFYMYLQHHPDEQKNFDLGIKSQTTWQSNAPSYYDFSQYKTVVDMAGGCGGLLKAVLSKCPGIQGILFESAAVHKNVLPELLTDDTFKSRFQMVEGDFLCSVDCVADLFMVAMTLHCFEDPKLVVILANIATAMRRKPGSRLLILEVDYEKSLIPNNPSGARQLDMTMMLIMGGRERDLPTWRSILDSQGIRVLQKIVFPPNFMGLECELK